MWDVIELQRWVGVRLVLPLAQRWLLPLLLLAKDVNGILQLYEPCPLSVIVLFLSFGVLSDSLPSHDGLLLLLEPLYLLLHPDHLFLLCRGFILFRFLILVLHLHLIELLLWRRCPRR
jgi:hypothetical protein